MAVDCSSPPELQRTDMGLPVRIGSSAEHDSQFRLANTMEPTAQLQMLSIHALFNWGGRLNRFGFLDPERIFPWPTRQGHSDDNHQQQPPSLDDGPQRANGSPLAGYGVSAKDKASHRYQQGFQSVSECSTGRKCGDSRHPDPPGNMQGYRRAAVGVTIQNSTISNQKSGESNSNSAIHRNRQYLRNRNVSNEYYSKGTPSSKLDLAEFLKFRRNFTDRDVTVGDSMAGVPRVFSEHHGRRAYHPRRGAGRGQRKPPADHLTGSAGGTKSRA